jgi:prolyl-tRNA synthetase
MSDFCTGANEEAIHLTGVNFGRDLPEPEVADIRNVVAGDPSPDGKGTLEIARGIEVGHVFQLRTDVLAKMGATYVEREGRGSPDGDGLLRHRRHARRGRRDRAEPRRARDHLARSDGALRGRDHPDGLSTAASGDARPRQALRELIAAGVEAFLDDRDERPGVLLADQELIGIPHRVVIGDRGLKEGVIEYQHRRDAQATKVAWPMPRSTWRAPRACEGRCSRSLLAAAAALLRRRCACGRAAVRGAHASVRASLPPR